MDRWVDGARSGKGTVPVTRNATPSKFCTPPHRYFLRYFSSTHLVEEEGTFSSFRGLAKVFAVWGLPLSLYSDRGSHYFFTPKAGEKVAPRALTQGGRGLGQLGIEHFAAYSPQGRGRW